MLKRAAENEISDIDRLKSDIVKDYIEFIADKLLLDRIGISEVIYRHKHFTIEAHPYHTPENREKMGPYLSRKRIYDEKTKLMDSAYSPIVIYENETEMYNDWFDTIWQCCQDHQFPFHTEDNFKLLNTSLDIIKFKKLVVSLYHMQFTITDLSHTSYNFINTIKQLYTHRTHRSAIDEFILSMGPTIIPKDLIYHTSIIYEIIKSIGPTGIRNDFLRDYFIVEDGRQYLFHDYIEELYNRELDRVLSEHP